MSIANTESQTIFEAGIVESNDQTEARVEHLKELETLVGNSYPNKFDRSKITSKEDTISNILAFAAVKEIVKELKDNTPEGEKPNQELKESLNIKLKEFGNVRVSGRLTTTPRTMGKAAFVHLSDGVNRLQIYVRRDDVQGVFNGKLTPKGEPQNQTPAPVAVTGWELFKLLDGGDFVGVEGFLFLTNTGELSVHVETLQFLSKALLPMPDKMHGIADPELRRRFRYADLIASSLQVEHEGLTTREVFERRAKLISGMRRFLDDAGYIEVETPMLTPKATGAAATPFETHHNALDIPLYARIAPELYLKRLTVGGFEKVYELNRNFRNEGLSHKHNPEFTMLEFYCAYMDVNGMMDFAEAMIKESVQKAAGSLQVKYGESEIDFEKPFERISMKQAIANYLPLKLIPGFEMSWFDDKVKTVALSWAIESINSDQNLVVLVSKDANNKLILKGFDKRFEKLEIEQYLKNNWHIAPNLRTSHIEEDWKNYLRDAELLVKANEISDDESEKFMSDLFQNIVNDYLNKAEQEKENFSDNEQVKRTVDIFDNSTEIKLIQPTFIIDYPKSISPLSKASPANPQIAERFELFINGMEVANGFSELNDPQEQFERFVDQMKERETGDHEAMVLDEDYIRALAYGMPPAAGIGIGIDRLVMLLTNRHSIRDVILFPHMRPERREEKSEDED